MKRRIDQFGRLSGMAGEAADQLAAALAEQQRKLHEAEAKLQELQRFQGEYTDGALATQTMSALLNQREFVQRIGEAMVFQRQVIARQRESCVAAEQRWREARARARAIGSVHDRLRDEDRRIEDRSEQAQIDELALRGRLQEHK